VPTVTGLTAIPKQPGRIAIEIDGDAAAIVAVEVVARLGLSVDSELSTEALSVLAEEGAALRTYDRALRMLAARGRSVRELRRRLLAAKEPESYVDAALERLVTMGLLDDAEYARQVARSQMVGRGYAPRRLQQELARRGVARDVADRAIDLVRSEDAAPGSFGAEEGIVLTDAIAKLARRKLRSLVSVDAETRARRLYAFLARRGYDSDDIRKVMAEIRAEENTADSA
jgi:regulatory protein